jgi:hypothetical protein
MGYTRLAVDLEAFGPGQELLNLSLAGEFGFMVRTGRWFSGHELGFFQGMQREHFGVRNEFQLVFAGLEKGIR